MQQDSRQSKDDNNPIVEILGDGSRVQTYKDGTTLTVYPSGVRIQRMKDGLQIEVRPDGKRIQTMASGTVIEINADGSTKQINEDGTVVETFADKRRVQSNKDGSVIEVFPDGRKSVTYADGKRVTIDANGAKKEIEGTNEEESRLKRDSARGLGRVPRKKSSLVANEERLVEENAQLRAELARRGETNDEILKDKETTIETLEKYIIELNDEKVHEVQEKAMQIAHLNALIEKFEGERNKMAEQLESLKQNDSLEVNKLKEEVAHLKSLNEGLRGNQPSSNAMREMSELKSLLFEKEAEILTFKSEIKSKDETISHMEDELTKRSADLKICHDENMLIKKEKIELEAKIEDLIDKGGSVAEEYSGLHDENEDLKKAKQAMQTEVDKLNADVAKFLERNSELETQVSKLLTDAHSSAMMQKRDLYLSKYKKNDGFEIESKTTSFSSEETGTDVKSRKTQLGKNLVKIFGKKKDDMKMKTLEQRVKELETNIFQKDLMIKKQIEIMKEMKDEMKQKDQRIFQLNSLTIVDQVEEARRPRVETVGDEDKHLLRETNANLQEEIAQLQEKLESSAKKAEERFGALNEQFEGSKQQVESLQQELRKTQMMSIAAAPSPKKDALSAEIVEMKIVPRNPECPQKFLILYKARGNIAGPVKHAMTLAGFDPELLFPNDADEPDTISVPVEESKIAINTPVKTNVEMKAVPSNPECPEKYLKLYNARGKLAEPVKHAMRFAGVDSELLFPNDSEEPDVKMVPVEDDSATQKPVPSTPPRVNFLDEIKNPGNKLRSTQVYNDAATSASPGPMSFLQQISSKEFKLKAVSEEQPTSPEKKSNEPPDFLSAIKSGVKLKPVKGAVEDKPDNTTGSEESLLDAIKKRQQNGLKKVSFSKRSPVRKEEQKNTVAELCKLKAQQRAVRTERISDLVKKRSNQQSDSSSDELKAALQRRANKIN